MKNRILAILFVVVVGINGFAGDKEELERTFIGYKNAALKDDGKEAVKYMDSHTIKYYDEVVKDALTMKLEDFNRLDFMTKLMVLRVRNEFNEEKLKKLDGKKLFIYALEKGWVSKASFNQVKKLEFEIDNYKAKGFLPNYKEMAVFYFIKEKGSWKIALWKNLELGSVFFQAAVKKSGLKENDYILDLIAKISKFKVNRAILDGPVK